MLENSDRSFSNFKLSVTNILSEKYSNLNNEELLYKIKDIYYHELTGKDRERYREAPIINNMISLSEIPNFLKQSSFYREILEDHEENQTEKNIPISPEVFTIEDENFHIYNFVWLINICDYWIVDNVPKFLLDIFFTN